MDVRRRSIMLFVLLHQMCCRSFMLLCLLIRHRDALLAKQRREPRRKPGLYTMTTRINAQLSHLHRIVELGDVQCVVNLRMNRQAFSRLCYLVSTIGGLVESRYVRIEEKVAMFLSILGHHKKNRVIGHDYRRSGHTISTHFHEDMLSILKLHPILLVKPRPLDDNCSNESWKWFKGCLGALDGTFITIHVPTRDKAKYRTRKADARVLRDALTRDDSLKVPRGFYYLCDNGYANVEGFLTPYRRVRYFKDAWGNRAFCNAR
ncbi:uncharacterized protein LOC142552377 [Primulina tabacum]|uniref:uncharacterized protein LOC142552377 n=1 Tax=Primulina tabacum TaxID=48773 RepID=UPI003F5AD45D